MTIRTTLIGSAFAAFVSLQGVCPAGAAEFWNVTEGGSASRGVWSLTGTGTGFSGSADMFNPKAGKFRYTVAGSVDGGVYSFKRLASNDGGTCVYTGTRRPDGKIVGTASCRDGSGSWLAEPMR